MPVAWTGASCAALWFPSGPSSAEMTVFARQVTLWSGVLGTLPDWDKLGVSTQHRNQLTD